MSTLLQITNQVLRRLREETVSDLTEDYPMLVASFVADIAQEVNEAFSWSALDHTVEVDVVAGTRTYTLAATNSNSTVLYDGDSPQAWIFDDADDQYGKNMIQLSKEDLERLYRQDTSLDNDKPFYFSIYPSNDFSWQMMDVWPIPSASRVIRIRFNSPEEELDPDLDAGTDIKVPERVVRLGALYLALNERGEEIGEPGNIAQERYIKSLAAAIESEVRNRERMGHYDWYRN